jgi:hypothetical protein
VKRTWRLVGLVLVAPLAIIALAVFLFPRARPSTPQAVTQRQIAIPAAAQRPAFDHWLARDATRASEFAAFERFIADHGYGDLLPAWTLLRTNSNKSGRCRVDPFILPPRSLWPNILPALKLVREQAIPAVGRVEVASAFRLAALNNCSRGASRSRHLSFSALDLIPLDQPDAPTSFAKLCNQWRKAGSGSRWGLGAYYDAARPRENQVARFHVDGTGWRTWGFSYGRASSGCNSL